MKISYPKRLLIKTKINYLFSIVLFIFSVSIFVFLVFYATSNSPLSAYSNLVFIFSVGIIMYMFFSFKTKHEKYLKRKNSIKKGIKAEDDVENILKTLDRKRYSVRNNIEVKGFGKTFDITKNF